MYYERVFRVFEEYDVRYLVADGMAVNLHGVSRFTKDLDILIDASAFNLKRLGDALKALGYRPRAPGSLGEFLDRRN